MSFKSSLILTLLLVFQLSAEAKIYGPKRYDSIGLLTFVGTDFYNTTANFDNNSKETNLTSSNSYLLVDVPAGLRYTISPGWAAEAEVTGSYAQSKSSDILTGGTRTNSEIHEMRFSTDMLVETNGFDLIPEFEIVFPFKKIDKNTDSVMVGEGAGYISGKLNVQTEFGQTDFFSYIGYEKRDSGRSDLMPWSAGLGWNSGNGSLIGARLFGFQSINDDTDKKNQYSRQAVNNKVNGGSLKFYSVNPSVISAEALATWKLQKQWQLQVHGGLDLTGQNYSKGMFAGINLVIDWGERQRASLQRQRPKKEIVQPRGNGIAVESETIDFKEETSESKDQQYFAPPPPPRVAPRPKPRTNVGPSDEQIQDSLDGAEMQIELKRKKKK